MTLQPDDPTLAQAWIRGTAPDQVVDFYIPRGNVGEMGPRGPMGPSLNVGTVETVMGPAAPGTVGPTGLTGPKGDPGGFVGGTALATSDLNLIVAPGLYKQDNSANATAVRNYPRDSTGGVLAVFERVAPGASASVIQQFYPAVNSIAGTPVMYVRYSTTNNTAWTPWRIFASSRVDQTAGRAMYQWDSINDREQLIYGDTGWRQVGDLLINGWSMVGGNISVRRVGNIVYWRAWNLNGSAATNVAFCTIPNGFGLEAYTHRAGISDGDDFSFVSINNTNGLSAKAIVPILFKSVFSMWSYPTAQTWPTSLPGIASGGIPNV